MKLPSMATSRWLLVVTLVFAFFHGRYLRQRYEPNTWLFADGSFYFTTLRAVTEHGRLEQRDLQPQSWYVQDLGWNRNLTDDWSNVALGRNGGWYPKHPILLPLLAVPLYLLFGTIGTLMTNVGLNLLFVLLAFLLARRFVRLEVAALIACAIAAAPFTLAMSYTFSNDLLGADLILGALECTFAGCFGWAGVLAGLSLWSRVTNATFLPALVIIGVAEGGWRKVGRAALFSLLPLGVYGALNTYLFGAPWIISYERVLVRENGVAVTASHSRLFNVPWAAGFHRIVFGDDGAFKTFPLLIPGVIGLIALAFRRRAVAVALVLFLVLPSLVFLKYDWYRAHFLYALFGVSGIGMAALAALVPWFAPRPAGAALTLRRPAMMMAGLALVAVPSSLTWKKHHEPPPELLSSHMHEAEVRLDSIPCDYWNPQVERWECSSYDRGGWWMTGRMMQPAPVKGVPRSAIWINANQHLRHVIFHTLPAHRVALTFAIDDVSRPGPAEITVLARGHAPEMVQLSHPGEEQQRTVEIGDGPGPALELQARTPDASGKHLIIEGRLE